MKTPVQVDIELFGFGEYVGAVRCSESLTKPGWFGLSLIEDGSCATLIAPLPIPELKPLLCAMQEATLIAVDAYRRRLLAEHPTLPFDLSSGGSPS